MSFPMNVFSKDEHENAMLSELLDETKSPIKFNYQFESSHDTGVQVCRKDHFFIECFTCVNYTSSKSHDL